MESAPLSLYFGVPDGERVNLETLARAALEWTDIVRELATVIAPNIEFEIDFVQSQEGSVWLKNTLKAVQSGDRKALASLAGGTILFFSAGPLLHLQTDIGDGFWSKLGHEHNVDISETDKNDIISGVVKAINETDVADKRRNLVRQVEADKEVTAIGVGLEPDTGGPITEIRRDQFPAYGAIASVERDQSPEKRVAYEFKVDVQITRASLRPGDARPRWRFKQHDSEWSATIEDDEFVWALNQEKTGLPLAVGQHMIVDVAIDLKESDGVWEEADRRIVRVHFPHVERAQGQLPLGGE